MCVVHDDVVGDVGIHGSRDGVGRGIDQNASLVLGNVVVGNGEET